MAFGATTPMMTKSAHLRDPPEAAKLFDEMLVVLAQAGDERALERLFRRWNPKLARAARRYCGNEEAALDLAQDCWIGIVKRLNALRDPAGFRSFAFAVLHRRGADYLRKTYREREVMAGQSQDAAQHSAPSDGIAITQAFAALPADQRLAAHLFFVEGLTLAEIAQVQSIPEGTAKSRLFHARQKLKAVLTDTVEGEE